MTISNLSIVLAPNLLWRQESSHSTNGISDSQIVNSVVANLIEHVDWYFDNPNVDFFDGVLISGSSVSMSERLSQSARTPTIPRAPIANQLPYSVHGNPSSSLAPHQNNSSSVTRAPVPTPRGSKHGSNGSTSSSNSSSCSFHNNSKPVIPAKPNLESIKSVQHDIANIKIAAESTNL